MRSKPYLIALIVLEIICWLALIWPGALIANRIEPYVLGVPFMIFWYVAWIFVMTMGLLLIYQIEYRDSKE